jgi:hypothetical protein
MSMQALNQLVARSIIDPTIVQAFTSGLIADILDGLDFSDEVRGKLIGLTAQTWAEFAVLAYRTVKAAEAIRTSIELPSPVEGLFREEGKSIGKEHAA